MNRHDPPSLAELAAALGTTVGSQAEPEDRYLWVDGLRLHYIEWGLRTAPAVVLLHSGEETAHSWDVLAAALVDRYRLIALDSRGCGGSDHARDGRYTEELYVRDVVGLITSLHLADVVLVGQAYGARHALIVAASQADRVRGLVMVDTAPEVDPAATEEVHSLLRRTLSVGSYEEFVRIMSDHNPLRTLAQVCALLRHEVCQQNDGSWTWRRDPRTVLDSASDDSEMSTPGFLWSALAQLRCPTLVVHGELSPFLSAAVANRMCRTIPNARLETIADAGHLVAGDNPVAFELAIRGFLQELEERNPIR